MFNYIQTDESTCGPIAIDYIIELSYGRTASISLLKKVCNTDKDGTDLINIKKGLSKIGICCNAYKFEDITEIKKGILPCITLLHDIDNHYVVLLKVDKKVVYLDPIDGKRHSCSLKMFSKQWIPILFGNFLIEDKTLFELTTIAKEIKFRFRYIIVIFSVFSILAYSLSLYIAQLFARYVDIVVPDKSISLFISTTIIFFICTILQYMFSCIASILSVKVDCNVEEELCKKFIESFLQGEYKYVRSNEVSDIITQINTLPNLRKRVLFFYEMLPLQIICIGITLYFLYEYSIALLVLSVIPIVCVALLYLFSKYKYIKKGKVVYDSENDFNSYLIESINNLQSVESFEITSHVLDRLLNKLENKFMSISNYITYDMLVKLTNRFFMNMYMFVVISLGVYLVINDQISLGVIFVFNSLIWNIFNPVLDLANTQADLRNGQIALSKYANMISVPSRAHNKTRIRRIALSDLSFSYKRNKELLYKINLVFEYGEKILLKGNSGAGKTTLAELIVGLTEPDSGKIKYYDFSGRELSNKTRYENIIYIPQRPQLFRDTIYNNIAMYDASISKNSVKDVILTLMGDDFFQDLPNGLDTVIGDGYNLSYGQTQVVCLSRAILSHADFIIFDEITNGLDEKIKQKALSKLASIESTVIMISHDKELEEYFDIVYTL